MAKNLKTMTPAQFAFIKWLNDRHPALLRAAEEQHASLSGFMDTLNQTFSTIMEKAPDLAKQYVQGQQQIAELKINLQRAQANQYPLDTGAVYTGGALSPSSGANFLPVILIGGLGLGVLYLLTRK